MNFNEYQEDLFVRYHHILGKRQNDRQKERFIRSLLIDLGNIRKDIYVIESKNASSKSVISRNIYVGDVKKTSKIWVTYYDTPMAHWGSYYFFDKDRQEKSTLSFNLVMGLLFLIIGLVFTVGYTIPVLNQGPAQVWQLIFMIIVYFILTWLIGSFAKGRPRRHNLIRNTSSILWMIQKIQSSTQKDCAFAFVDNGTTNDHGLKSLMKSVKSNAQVYYLDAVGADAHLYYKDDEEFVPITSGNQLPFSQTFIHIFAGNIENNVAFLNRGQLNAQKMNDNNFQLLDSLFK